MDILGLKVLQSPFVPRGEVWIICGEPRFPGETTADYAARLAVASVRLINVSGLTEGPEAPQK